MTKQMFFCPIAHHAHLSRDKPAIEQGSAVLSYGKLDTEIQRLQLYLKTLNPSAKIGIIAHYSIDTILLYFAALRNSLSVCVISPKDPPSLLQEKMTELNLTALFTKAPILHQKSTATYPSIPIINKASITYLYTSGSCAKPKIAALSYANLIYSALGLLELLHLTPQSRYLLSLPLNHVSGLSILFRAFLSGSTVVVPPSSYHLSTLLKDASISHLSLVSTQYLQLLKTLTSTLPTLTSILLGGSSFSQSSLQEGIDKKLPLYLSYGLTEMSSTVCCNPLLETKDPSYGGYLLPYRKIKLTKEGEILVKGKTLFQGYYDIEARCILQQKGWFATKDLGMVQGTALKVYGRKDRLIISGGENIQPEEIELALLNITGVEKALVLAIAEECFGQKIIAITDTDLPPHTLHKHLEKTLPRYKLPKTYLPWPHHLKPEGVKISNSLKKEILLYLMTKYNLGDEAQ